MCKNMSSKKWSKISEAAAHFSIGKSLLYELMAEWDLDYLPVGPRGRRRITRQYPQLGAESTMSDSHRLRPLL